jgi:hypothetical protein
MSVTKRRIFKHGVFMNDREFSDIEIFPHSGKVIPLFMAGHKICPTSRLQQWAGYPLFSKLNELTSLLQISVTNQQGNIKKNFPLP